MNKEDLFDDDFLKQFKSGEELSNFLKQLQKRELEKMLEGELHGHLDYEKHQGSRMEIPGMVIPQRKSGDPLERQT